MNGHEFVDVIMTSSGIGSYMVSLMDSVVEDDQIVPDLLTPPEALLGELSASSGAGGAAPLNTAAILASHTFAQSGAPAAVNNLNSSSASGAGSGNSASVLGVDHIIAFPGQVSRIVVFSDYGNRTKNEYRCIWHAFSLCFNKFIHKRKSEIWVG